MPLTDWCTELGSTQDSADIVRCLVYGDTGVGKTRFAGTFPNPLFIDADKGTRTLKDVDYPLIPIQRGDRVFNKMMDILVAFDTKVFPKGLEEKFEQTETLVIDSASVVADLILAEAMKYPPQGLVSQNRLTKKPEWDHYDVVGARMDELIRRALDLPMNLVVTAGQKLDKDQITGGYVGQPDIVGGYRNKIGHAFDEFFYFGNEVKDGALKYFAYTGKYRYFAAKSRDGREYRIENPTYENLYAKGA